MSVAANTLVADQNLLDAANILLKKEDASEGEYKSMALIILQRWNLNKKPEFYEVVNKLKNRITDNVTVRLLGIGIKKIAEGTIPKGPNL